MTAVLRLLLHQLPGLTVGAAVGALVGVYVLAPVLDRYRRAHPTQETTAMTDSLGKSKMRITYEKWAPAVAGIALLTGIFGSTTSTINQRTTNRETSARIAQANSLLACFDRFAAALAGGLPPVRAASAERDDALESVLGSLNKVVSAAIKGTEIPPDDPIITGLVTSLNAYQAASSHLDQVRAENPYPPPPTQFCDIDLADDPTG